MPPKCSSSLVATNRSFPLTPRTSYLRVSMVYATAVLTKGGWFGSASTLGVGFFSLAVYTASSSSALLTSSNSSSPSLLRSSNRPVAMANLIVAETMAVVGDYLSSGPSLPLIRPPSQCIS